MKKNTTCHNGVERWNGIWKLPCFRNSKRIETQPHSGFICKCSDENKIEWKAFKTHIMLPSTRITSGGQITSVWGTLASQMRNVLLKDRDLRQHQFQFNCMKPVKWYWGPHRYCGSIYMWIYYLSYWNNVNGIDLLIVKYKLCMFES